MHYAILYKKNPKNPYHSTDKIEGCVEFDGRNVYLYGSPAFITEWYDEFLLDKWEKAKKEAMYPLQVLLNRTFSHFSFPSGTPTETKKVFDAAVAQAGGVSIEVKQHESKIEKANSVRIKE